MFAILVMVGLTQCAPAQNTPAPTLAAQHLDPVGVPAGAVVGSLAGGLLGSGAALSMALLAEGATGEEVTAEARTLNQLATFATLVAPALFSVLGAAVGAGLAGGLVGALTAGFGATVGAAVATGVGLVAVPLSGGESAAFGGPLGATAALAGLVVGGASLGGGIGAVLAALTVNAETLDGEVGGPVAEGFDEEGSSPDPVD